MELTHFPKLSDQTWCGLAWVGAQKPWPITCKACCIAIRKSRKRQLQLEKRHSKLNDVERAELQGLDQASWPDYRPPNPERVVPDGKPFRVTGPKPKGKRPKLLRSSKKATAFVKRVIARAKLGVIDPKLDPETFFRLHTEQEIREIQYLVRLWLSEKEEAEIQALRKMYPKILFGKIQTYVPPPPSRVVTPKTPGSKKLRGPQGNS